jgi:hypothetical protein
MGFFNMEFDQVYGLVYRIRDIILVVVVEETIKHFWQVFCNFLSQNLCVVD